MAFAVGMKSNKTIAWNLSQKPTNNAMAKTERDQKHKQHRKPKNEHHKPHRKRGGVISSTTGS